MVDCNYENFACAGGYLMTTIDYLQIEGLVTRECQPYKGFAGKCEYTCTTPDVPHNKFFCEIGSLKVMTKAEEI